MIQKLRSHLLLGTVIGATLFGPLSSQAAPILLYAGGSVGVGSPSAIADGTVVAGGSLLTSFTAAGITGQLGVTILSGVSANPNAGGLTFVYELANLNADVPEEEAEPGVLNWVVGPFDLTTTYFELGSSFFYSPSGTPVLPEFAIMDAFGSVTVTYPPDFGAPPIFSGENTWQMIFHTNATEWVTTGTSMEMYMDDLSTPSWSPTPTWVVSGISTLTPLAAVPDGGATLLPLAFALLALHRFQRRRG